VQGFGTAVVTATDAYTQLGQIAKMVNRPQENKTPLQKALSDFATRAAGFVLVFAVILFFIASISGISLIQSFLIAVAVLVSAIPEGLPIVITIILAIGVQRLAKRKGVVRQLSAAETLGSTSVILTDKTGTLTQAKMTLAGVKIFESNSTITDSARQEEFLLHTALLNVDVVIENPTAPHSSWRLLGKPLEVALVKGAAEKNIHFPSLKEGKQVLHVLPFNSLNKFSASVYRMPANWFTGCFKTKEPYVLSLMGAPEMLFKLSDGDAQEHERILSEIRAMANAGERVVGIAVREIDNIDEFELKNREHLKGLRFVGTVSMRDPLRPNVGKALATVESSGIKVVIVTGDHEGTATAIARELGMQIKPGNIIDGVALDEMSEIELAGRLDLLKIVSRVSPQGKMKIVKAFQARGDIVAMNGDGINDAPALKQANIGIAMGSGTDVSKDVAELVLLDDNFETIVAAVIEGRRILGNIRKAMVYMTSTILNEIVLIGGSLIIGVPIPINPLQILWINFFTDSFPGIALAFEKNLDVTRAPARTKGGVFNSEMKFLIVINGTISSLLLYAAYDLLLRMGFDPSIVRSFTYAALGTYGLLMVLSIRSLRQSIFSYNPFANKALNLSVVVGIALTFVVLYVPSLQRYFDTVALPPLWVAGVFGFGIFNIFLIELTKMFFHRESEGR
jgi:Ca2+-transporting ATPase